MATATRLLERFIPLLFLLLASCSYEKYAIVDIRMNGRPSSIVVVQLQEIGHGLQYRAGAIPPNDPSASPVALLERDNEYLFYFVHEDRTSIKVKVPKHNGDSNATVTFAEFGVKEFTSRGLTQYRRLIEALVAVFGDASVVPRE